MKFNFQESRKNSLRCVKLALFSILEELNISHFGPVMSNQAANFLPTFCKKRTLFSLNCSTWNVTVTILFTFQMPSKESKFEEAVSNVQFLVPMSAVEVHGAVNRERDRLFLWDLLVHRGTQTQCLRMASKALNTKESFLRAIRTSIKENMRLNASKSRRGSSRASDMAGNGGAVPRSL